MFSGDGDEPVSTGTDSGSTEKAKSDDKPIDDGSKKVDASDQSTDAAGLIVALGEVKISSDKIQVGINVENTTENKLSFYPDQGSAVIGDIQLDANMFLTDGDVSGEIQGGVKKEAVLEFLTPDGKEIDVNSIKEVKLMLGDVFNDTTFESKPVNFTIPIK
ncbi:hypothetical protein BK139_05035 [Paenibacillus sp. FSL R5-0490]|nr:hypothetical protein BK139_05035 [Paenibacillus sp. FSL R5-0490]